MPSENVTEWCITQCRKQHATRPIDFKAMLNAWDYAAGMYHAFGRRIDINDIRILGAKADPDANPGGRFRKGPAVFMDGGIAASANTIEPRLMALLIYLDENIDMEPADFYKELMWIHPFRDANGRVGSLVYNMLNGTIDNPVDPPEYK